jgi:hypothetical protein
MRHGPVRTIALAALLAMGAFVHGAQPESSVAPGWKPPSLAAALGPEWKNLPDWRGVWYLQEPLLFAGPEKSVIPAGAKPGPKLIRGVEFQNGLPAGSHFTGAPYRPEYQKLYDERVAKALATDAAEDPVENCWLPQGMPRMIGAGPGAVEFHVTPRMTWIIWDRMNQTRRIHTDGSGHPEDEEWPRVMGHSVGHWEGATLVVDTVWRNEGIYDRSGAPYSDQLHLTERITRTDADTISIAMTLEDPVMFTAPWRVTRLYKRSAKPQENVRGTYCDSGDTQAIKVGQ